MKRRGFATTLGAFVAGVATFALLCELLFRLLPVSSTTMQGYYIDPKIPTYAPHLDWRYATGWDLRNAQHLRTNNLGFVSAHDFVPNAKAVALIGDSYIESASLGGAERPGEQLERALGGARPVYAMGSVGTAALEYAERIRYASEQLGIRDFVVFMERGDLVQSVCDPRAPQSQCLDLQTLTLHTTTLPPASPLKQLLRRSAFAQYLFSQLKVDPGSVMQRAFARSAVPEAVSLPPPAKPAPSRETLAHSLRVVEAVSALFFKRVKPYVHGRLVIVVDSDRAALMRDESTDDAPRRRFIELARANGAIVVDTEPLFRRHFEHSDLSPDNGPYDGHLNALAVRLVADAAARALR
jgi:hypothetical protein